MRADYLYFCILIILALPFKTDSNPFVIVVNDQVKDIDKIRLSSLLQSSRSCVQIASTSHQFIEHIHNLITSNPHQDYSLNQEHIAKIEEVGCGQRPISIGLIVYGLEELKATIDLFIKTESSSFDFKKLRAVFVHRSSFFTGVHNKFYTSHKTQ
jgi:hypothetical protein